MKYEVTGKVPSKGNRTGRTVVRAQSSEEAVEKARRRGLIAESVDPIVPEADPADVADNDTEPTPPYPSEGADVWEGLEDIEVEQVPSVPVRRRRADPYSRSMRRPKVTRESRFWLLQFLVSSGYLLALIVFGISVAVAVLSMFVPLANGATTPFLTSLSIPISTAVMLLPILIWIQLIDCFLAIEENTRKPFQSGDSRGIRFDSGSQHG